MSDLRPDRDDFIHRVFRHLRAGFADIVVNLVDRVDKRLEVFIDDERHTPPDVDDLAIDAVSDTAGVFSSVIASLAPLVDAADGAADSQKNSVENSAEPSSDEPDTD